MEQAVSWNGSCVPISSPSSVNYCTITHLPAWRRMGSVLGMHAEFFTSVPALENCANACSNGQQKLRTQSLIGDIFFTVNSSTHVPHWHVRPLLHRGSIVSWTKDQIPRWKNPDVIEKIILYCLLTVVSFSTIIWKRKWVWWWMEPPWKHVMHSHFEGTKMKSESNCRTTLCTWVYSRAIDPFWLSERQCKYLLAAENTPRVVPEGFNKELAHICGVHWTGLLSDNTARLG